MKKLCFLIFILFFAGCAAAPRPTAQQVNAADCGPMPINHQEIIKGIVNQRLFDPYTAQYTFSPPVKAWNNMTNPPIYGWRVCGTINSKNRFGGYVGAKPFYALFSNGQISRFIFDTIIIPDNQKMGYYSVWLRDNSSFLNSVCK